MIYNEQARFADLTGETLTAIEREGDERLTFRAGDKVWLMLHHQDCCENVEIEEIIGDLHALVDDGPVLLAEEASNNETDGDWGDSTTWTFYKLRTLNGDVTIRWKGTSNGYYSEAVDFEFVAPTT